jgi:hypothetical protein
MSRPLELLDLPTVYRYREVVVNLDSARWLTRGNPLGAVGLLSYLNPERHVYSAIEETDSGPLVGGVIHTRGESQARLLYLAPGPSLISPKIGSLLEHLCVEAGIWGAYHVLAEAVEGSEAYQVLRESGFSVYAWQRMWDLSPLLESDSASHYWRRMESTDVMAVQALHHQIIPALLHPIEQPPREPVGMICNSDGIRGYVSLAYGLYGVVLSPLIHPDAANVPEKISQLCNHVPDRRGRKLYLCVRSYQAWLEPVLEDLGALPSERQAVMVKHLARPIKDEQTVPNVQRQAAIQPSQVSQVQEKK